LIILGCVVFGYCVLMVVGCINMGGQGVVI
jgi:hypothetical protein